MNFEITKSFFLHFVMPIYLKQKTKNLLMSVTGDQLNYRISNKLIACIM